MRRPPLTGHVPPKSLQYVPEVVALESANQAFQMVNRCIYWRQFSIILIDNGGKTQSFVKFFLLFFFA